MVIVDTSVWIAHLRQHNTDLESLLQEAEVMTHEFVLGELACGNIKNRKEFLSLLEVLPSASVVNQNEFLHFVESNSLMGSGVGFVDVHLLASAQLMKFPLWTRDEKLHQAAIKLKLSYRNNVK